MSEPLPYDLVIGDCFMVYVQNHHKQKWTCITLYRQGFVVHESNKHEIKWQQSNILTTGTPIILTFLLALCILTVYMYLVKISTTRSMRTVHDCKEKLANNS